MPHTSILYATSDSYQTEFGTSSGDPARIHEPGRKSRRCHPVRYRVNKTGMCAQDAQDRDRPPERSTPSTTTREPLGDSLPGASFRELPELPSIRSDRPGGLQRSNLARSRWRSPQPPPVIPVSRSENAPFPRFPACSHQTTTELHADNADTLLGDGWYFTRTLLLLEIRHGPFGSCFRMLTSSIEGERRHIRDTIESPSRTTPTRTG